VHHPSVVAPCIHSVALMGYPAKDLSYSAHKDFFVEKNVIFCKWWRLIDPAVLVLWCWWIINTSQIYWCHKYT